MLVCSSNCADFPSEMLFPVDVKDNRRNWIDFGLFNSEKYLNIYCNCADFPSEMLFPEDVQDNRRNWIDLGLFNLEK